MQGTQQYTVSVYSNQLSFVFLYLKKLLLLSGLSLFLLACGGGNGGSNLPQVDSNPPVISSKTPDNRSIDIDIIQPITVTFNEALGSATEDNVALFKYQSTDPDNFDEILPANDRVNIRVVVENNKLIITPTPRTVDGFVPFTIESRYKLTLLGIKDKVGNSMADTSWEFATTSIPIIKNIQPLLNETVSRATDITITFNEQMDPLSLETGFKLEDLGPIASPTPGVRVDGITPIFDALTNTATYSLPASAPFLNANSNYSVTLALAKDLKGNIAATATSTFSTSNVTDNTVLATQPGTVTAAAHVSSVDISWLPARAIAGQTILYNVYVSTDNKSFKLLTNTGPIANLTYTDPDAVNNITYYYAITANADNLESDKVFSRAAVTPLALIGFTNVANSVVTASAGFGKVDLSWPVASSAIAYNVYVKVKAGNSTTFTPYTLLNNKNFIITATTFTHDNDPGGLKLASASLKAVNYNTYVYKVAAINANWDEGPQTILESVPATPAEVSTITNFTANPADVTTGQRVTLTAVFTNGTGIITSTNGDSISAGIATATAKTFSTTVTPAASGTTTYTLNVSNNGVSATPMTVTVKVLQPGKFAFKKPSSFVNETVGTVTLKVLRTGGFDGKVTVDYRTFMPGDTATASTATAKNDYIVTTGQLIFLDGEFEKNITITINNDKVMNESNEFFSVSLSNPAGGATLDLTPNPDKTVHVVTIIDNDILTLNYDIKQLKFNWTAYPGATFYKLMENINKAGYRQVGADITSTSHTLVISVYAHDWLDTKYILEACINNFTPCIMTNIVTTSNPMDKTINMVKTIGYIKASNTATGVVSSVPGFGNTDATGDHFGNSVAMNDDGTVLAVGAPAEDSNTKTINGDGTNDAAGNSGAVYVYHLLNGIWTEKAYIKASNSRTGYQFGNSISLSGDGNTLAVGSWAEGSGSRTINGVETYDAARSNSGAVYVYRYDGTNWTKQAHIKALNADQTDTFGFDVALDFLGNTLVVGARNESSNSVSINTGSADNSLPGSGAVYVFRYENVNSILQWSQQSYLKASQNGVVSGSLYFNGNFGYCVDISNDGNTIAVGAESESSTTGQFTGAAYIYEFKNAAWQEQAHILPSNPSVQSRFGYSIALNGAGDRVVVGARLEGTSATGIKTNQTTSDKLKDQSGAAYIFSYNNSLLKWQQSVFIKSPNAESLEWFGESVDISKDGNTVAVGTVLEDSSSIGVNGNEANNAAENSGAVFLYKYDGIQWLKSAYIKALDTTGINLPLRSISVTRINVGDQFGKSVALNKDGSALAVGAYMEDGKLKGVSNNIVDAQDNSILDAGAVFLY